MQQFVVVSNSWGQFKPLDLLEERAIPCGKFFSFDFMDHFFKTRLGKTFYLNRRMLTHSEALKKTFYLDL